MVTLKRWHSCCLGRGELTLQLRLYYSKVPLHSIYPDSWIKSIIIVIFKSYLEMMTILCTGEIKQLYNDKTKYRIVPTFRWQLLCSLLSYNVHKNNLSAVKLKAEKYKNRSFILPARPFISLCHLVPLDVTAAAVEHHLFVNHEAAMLADDLVKVR